VWYVKDDQHAARELVSLAQHWCCHLLAAHPLCHTECQLLKWDDELLLHMSLLSKLMESVEEAATHPFEWWSWRVHVCSMKANQDRLKQGTRQPDHEEASLTRGLL
jgi:hypothetical protein